MTDAEQQQELEVLDRIVARGDLRLLGLPVDDIRDIYKIIQEWNRCGGRQGWIEDFRRRERLLDGIHAAVSFTYIEGEAARLKARVALKQAAGWPLDGEEARLKEIEAMPADLTGDSAESTELVGWMIRTRNRHGFRCGEWARCTAFVADAADGPCWLVEFADGVIDWWRVDDPAGDYEFSPMSRRVKRARQEAGLD